MTTQQSYYLGIILCSIIATIITPFYGVFIIFIRLAQCLWGIAYDTFFFIPTMISAFHYNFWKKIVESNEKNNDLN